MSDLWVGEDVEHRRDVRSPPGSKPKLGRGIEDRLSTDPHPTLGNHGGDEARHGGSVTPSPGERSAAGLLGGLSGRVGPPMDHQTTFLLALGMLIAASLVVSLSGWVLFARERAMHRAAMHEAATTRDDSPHPIAGE
jgi:hypothetical protein